MNSKQRIRTAMELGTPDRVPVMCQLALGHYALRAGVDPMPMWFTSAGMAEASVTLAERYRFDGVLVNLPGRHPDTLDWVDRTEDTPEGMKVHFKQGGYCLVPPDDNVYYFNDEGERRFPSFDEVDPERLYYVEPWDTTCVSYPYRWGFDEPAEPGGAFFPPYIHDTLKEVLAKVGDTLSVHSEVFSPFSQFMELLDFQNGLMALMDDRGKCHAILERLTEGAIDLGCRQAECGVEAVLISSAFAGAGFIGQEMYSEFVLPYEKKLIEGVKRRFDVKVYTHTCGAIGDRLEMMLETGTNGIDTLDPPPLGTVELEDAVERLRGRAFIKGNLDPVNTMLLGDKEKVRAAVKHRIETAGPGGGYILSTACSMPPKTPPEHIEMLVELAEELGRFGG